MDRLECEMSAQRQLDSVMVALNNPEMGEEELPKRWLVAVFELLPNGEVSMKRTTHNFDLAKAEQAGSMLVGDLLRERDGSVIRTPLPAADGFPRPLPVGHDFSSAGIANETNESDGSVAVSEGVATSE